ncbi:hypothetical protein [Pseudobacter ginsenosidimutans]|uniref:ZU5 domain-containing protein n=1 Tax=Pseudobacter ginsenosidimutans TaxID=661488 RepID=A0A4Q7N0U3_9BACT|nr:hypothetical protein [Pseudobacter ginsenosidimutans]QEC42835.1 hypothetical protein FSB84_14500 [Pseudobacter ginsenosidimutans]RZS74184.1 hypothetical protein EV199_0028 [Pseudobacter ginsenosidimutans]
MFLLICCKKNEGGKDNIPRVAVPKEHGTPVGTAVSKVIGPQGGSIESGDGRMSITVPSGAVNENTSFSIQPVTNTLTLGSGYSYRLLPENVNFNKDVEIRFKYDEQDLAGTDVDYLFLACQNAEGFWLRASNRTIDRTNKVLKVNTRHFSDWSIETSIRLVNKGKSVLTVGETTSFVVYIDPALGEEEQDGYLHLLLPEYGVADKNIKEWKVFGVGSISKSKTLEATYKAPAAIAASSTDIVEATVVNVLNEIDPTVFGSGGTLIIRENVQLEKEEYFYWSLKGSKFSGGITVAQAANGRTAISVNNGANSLSIQFSGQRTGSFSPGDMEQGGKLAVVGSLNGKIYQTSHTKCESNEKEYGQGSLSITKYGDVGGYIEGSLSVGSFHVDGCDAENGMILGSFRVKRKG